MQQNVPGPSPLTPNPKWTFDDYKFGRIPIPPYLYPKRMLEFIYGVDFPNPGGGSVNPAPTQTQMLQLDRDSHFLWEGLAVTNTSFFASVGPLDTYWGENVNMLGVDLHIYNLALGTSYSNITTEARNHSGAGYTQHYFVDPVLLGPSEILKLNLGEKQGAYFNNGAGPYRIAMFGRKVYGVTEQEYQMSRKRQWYVYNCGIPYSGIPNSTVFPSDGTEGISRTQIFADSDFLVRRISAVGLLYNIASVAVANGFDMEVLMNIRDTESGRSFFNKKINVRNFAGGRFAPQFGLGAGIYNSFFFQQAAPFTLAVPRLVKRNSILEIRAVVISPVTNPTYTIGPDWLALEGCKIYD